MIDNNAKCESCENEWKLRKPIDEIQRLRCSKCGKTGDSIQVEVGEGEQSGSGDLSVLERIELEEQHTDLSNRAEAVAERIRELGDSKVPEELEPVHRRLLAVSEELSERDDLSASELDEFEEFIEEQKTEFEDLGVANEITHLKEKKRELEMELKQLEAEIEESETNVKQLEQRKKRLLNVIGMARTFVR